MFTYSTQKIGFDTRKILVLGLPKKQDDRITELMILSGRLFSLNCLYFRDNDTCLLSRRFWFKSSANLKLKGDIAGIMLFSTKT